MSKSFQAGDRRGNAGYREILRELPVWSKSNAVATALLKESVLVGNLQIEIIVDRVV
jgi:hypothetical protein